MRETCHRCGEELSAAPGSWFCPHCGAPQLYLRDYIPSDSGVVAPVAGATSGTPPPPGPQLIDWQLAIRCAAMVAVGGAVLSALGGVIPLVGVLSGIWIISGSLITLGIYQSQRPTARMDARVGARIGLVVGVAMSLALGLEKAITGLVERFGLHRMAEVDGANLAMVEGLRAQLAVKLAPAPIPPELTGLLSSPEFFGGVVLVGFAMVGVTLILLSMAGGAFAGMMRSQARAKA